jgi:hypothetical protein
MLDHLLDPALILAALAFVGVIALWIVQLKQKGTPNDQIPGQLKLRAADLFDDGRDSFVQWAKEATAALAAKTASTPGAILKDAYYDKENFDRDIGRVMAGGYQGQLVKLDGKVAIDGDTPAIDYYTHTNGNVTTQAPPTA